jgi:cell division transport system permease protein
MCATMLIFGIFYTIGQNITHMLTEIEDAQGMQVFILNEAIDEEVRELGEQLKQIEGVNSIEFVSREDAYNQMRTRLSDWEGIMDSLEPGIFSPSYMITLTDLSLHTKVQNSINELDNIKRITSSNETINALANIGNAVRIITGVMLIILIAISIFIISNTIKLTVHVRRKEISIMKYVGATNNFIRAPFIIEGMIIGLLSGLLSILMVSGGYTYITQKIIETDMARTIGINALGFGNLVNEIVLVYILLGMGIGIIGSSISMRRYLDV